MIAFVVLWKLLLTVVLWNKYIGLCFYDNHIWSLTRVSPICKHPSVTCHRGVPLQMSPGHCHWSQSPSGKTASGPHLPAQSWGAHSSSLLVNSKLDWRDRRWIGQVHNYTTRWSKKQMVRNQTSCSLNSLSMCNWVVIKLCKTTVESESIHGAIN